MANDERPKATGDLLDRGVRADPNLPPMTSAQRQAAPDVEREHESTDVPEHDTVLPRPDPAAGRLGAEDVARLVGRDEDQRAATAAIDASHDREDTSES